MIEKHIYKLNVNPFWGGLIIQSFYSGYDKPTCPLILHYIILPVIMYSETKKIFQNISKNASIDDLISNNKVAFLGLQERIWAMRDLTNMALINLENKKIIKLKAEVEIMKTEIYEKYQDEIKSYLRSANYLGKILKDNETQDIFKKLKIIP